MGGLQSGEAMLLAISEKPFGASKVPVRRRIPRLRRNNAGETFHRKSGKNGGSKSLTPHRAISAQNHDRPFLSADCVRNKAGPSDGPRHNGTDTKKAGTARFPLSPRLLSAAGTFMVGEPSIGSNTTAVEGTSPRIPKDIPASTIDGEAISRQYVHIEAGPRQRAARPLISITKLTGMLQPDKLPVNVDEEISHRSSDFPYGFERIRRVAL